MGVKGLTPFLEKTFPQVIQHLPERFAALSGKRIVIDGTLITQRFHFAPMPQQYRHVLCWYRLAIHLRKNNVQAICVFDGGQRSVAKKAEIERRQQERQLATARGLFENDRLQRLRRVSTSLREWQSSDPDQLMDELAALRLETETSKPDTPSTPATSPQTHDLSDDTRASDESRPMFLPAPIPKAASDMDEPESNSAQQECLEQQHVEQPKLTTRLLQMLGGYMASIPRLSLTKSPPTDVELQLPPSADKSSEAIEATETPAISPFAKDVEADREEHALPKTQQGESPPTEVAPQSTDKSSEAIEATEETLAISPTVVVDEDAEADREEHALSKTQQSLADDEDRFWEMVSQLDATDGIPESIAKYAEDLEAKSAMLSESYQRRTDPPTPTTYVESREILGAMGIPCIEPTGAFEGEALAASLVINGYADYVASEDLDVLVYGAPLIRNISSMSEPLTLISTHEVCEAMGLDHTAFVDFALLLGTDFTTRIKNVGPARALKFINEHGTIERVVERATRYPPRMPPEVYLAQIALARMVFQTLPPIPTDEGDFQQGVVDEEEVSDILDRYDLRRFAMEEGDYSQALSGNYFGDNPTAS